MSTPESQPIDEKKLHEFMMKAVGDMGAAIGAALIVIGDKLGLYKAMAGAGPMTSAELASKTGTAERPRMARGASCQWNRYLRRQRGAVHVASRTGSGLGGRNGSVFLPGAYYIISACMKDEKITEAFRSEKALAGMSMTPAYSSAPSVSSPNYRAHLIGEWIPAMDGVESKLKAGGRVADVGCGLHFDDPDGSSSSASITTRIQSTWRGPLPPRPGYPTA